MILGSRYNRGQAAPADDRRFRPSPDRLAEAIRTIRLRNGLSQELFAAELGANPSHKLIHSWETGKTQPSAPYLLAMLVLVECGAEAAVLEQALLDPDTREGGVVRMLRDEYLERRAAEGVPL